MGYLLIIYLLVGAVLVLWGVPHYLRRRGVDTVDPSKALPVVVAGGGGILGIALLILSVWPVLVPLWIWSEQSAARERVRFVERQKKEAERMKNDPFANLSFDQKLDALKRIAEQK